MFPPSRRTVHVETSGFAVTPAWICATKSPSARLMFSPGPCTRRSAAYTRWLKAPSNLRAGDAGRVRLVLAC